MADHEQSFIIRQRMIAIAKSWDALALEEEPGEASKAINQAMIQGELDL
jgi:hypothetical protein